MADFLLLFSNLLRIISFIVFEKNTFNFFYSFRTRMLRDV